MAKNTPSYITASSTQIDELSDLIAKGNGFFHIGASEIPSIIPERLRKKWDSAVVVVPRSTEAGGAIAIIGHRIDKKAKMMDHDPFLMRVPTGNGVLMHHALFAKRSVPLPSDTSSLSTESYFKNSPTFGLSSGSTNQLPEPLIEAYNLANHALGSTSAST